MKRRTLLKSALLAISGVGWLIRRAGATFQKDLGFRFPTPRIFKPLIQPKPLEFACVYAKVAWTEAEGDRVVLDISRYYKPKVGYTAAQSDHQLLRVKFATGMPVSARYDEDPWLCLMWHKNEWWVFRIFCDNRENSGAYLRGHPVENRPFIAAFERCSDPDDPNQVIIDPFSKTAHHRT